MTASPTKPNRGGFTLIELLVVVAIISLLVSILLPSLKQAQEQAKIAVCKSNIRQICSLLWMYAADNGDHLPLQYWLRPHHYEYAQFLWHPYLQRDRSLLNCPSESARPGTGPGWFPWKAPHYGYNPRFSWATSDANGNLTLHSMATGDLKSPADTLWTADHLVQPNVRWPQSTSPFIDAWGCPSTVTYWGWQGWGRLHARHDNRLNLGYIDGHCETVGEMGVKPGDWNLP